MHDQVTLDHQHIKDVKIFKEQAIYKPSEDYVIDVSEGIIKRVKNGAIIADSVITIEYNQETPPELITSTQLLKEVGRRVVDEVLFCTGDDGELLTPSGSSCVKSQQKKFSLINYFSKVLCYEKCIDLS